MDVDGNLSTTQLVLTNGTLTVTLAGGATISAGANGKKTLTLSGTQAQINATLAITIFTQANIEARRVVFAHSGAVVMSDSFTLTVR